MTFLLVVLALHGQRYELRPYPTPLDCDRALMATVQRETRTLYGIACYDQRDIGRALTRELAPARVRGK